MTTTNAKIRQTALANLGPNSLLRRHWLAAGAAAMLSLSAALTVAAQNYPNRPITLIVPWGAGGGTDATARIIGSLLEKDLGQPVNVVNRTGGSGVVGHSAIATAAPDGYTIGVATVEIGMMHWQGLTALNGDSYTPLGLVNADPAGVQVRSDSPYKTVNDLVAAINAILDVQPAAEHVMMMEDDWLFCPHGLESLRYFLSKACAIKNNIHF